MNKQKTSVEWLVEQIESGKIEIVYSNKIYSIKCIPEILEQALAMEKEQIIESAERLKWVDYSLVKSGEQYYEETYGKSNT
jgi:hypothetical protein